VAAQSKLGVRSKWRPRSCIDCTINLGADRADLADLLSKESVQTIVWHEVVHHTRADAKFDNEHFDGKTTEYRYRLDPASVTGALGDMP
jgi:hypothetical protein